MSANKHPHTHTRLAALTQSCAVCETNSAKAPVISQRKHEHSSSIASTARRRGSFSIEGSSAHLTIRCGLLAPSAAILAATTAIWTPLAATDWSRGWRQWGWCSTIGSESPIRDVGWILVAVLFPAAAELPVHPIHIFGEPVTCDEDHALLNLCQHGIELRTPRAHALDYLTSLLAHRCGKHEIIAVRIKSLRKSKDLPAVDGVIRTRAEITGVSLDFRVAPLVAFPARVTAIIIGASMVRDLLHIHVPFVHIKLGTATQPRKALSVTVEILVLAGCGPWHVDKVKIQIASTRWAVHLEIDVHAESLPHEHWLVEVVLVTVISRGVLHEVESVIRRILDGPPTINSCSARQVVRVHRPILIDQDLAFVCSAQALALREIWLGVLRERMALPRRLPHSRTQLSQLHQRLIL